jgi:hypothetical protein
MQLLWGMMNDMSFLTILTLISQNTPGLAQMIMNILLGFIYMDGLMTDKWLPQLLMNE